MTTPSTSALVIVRASKEGPEMVDNDPRLMRQALRTAAAGMRVFPLRPSSKVPALGRGWQSRATLDESLIRQWWSRLPFNIGVVTGETVVVVDLDAPKAKGDPHGRQSLAVLADELGEQLPRWTRTVTTPGGGQHLYFRAPRDVVLRNTAGTLGLNIDTRAVGGYVVGPGSVLRGNLYRLVRDVAPEPLPEWILWRCLPAPTAAPPHQVPHHPAYIGAVVRGVATEVASARIGTRNSTLFRAAARLGTFVGQGRLTEDDAWATLEDACAVHHDMGPIEVHRTIRSGLRRGSGTAGPPSPTSGAIRGHQPPR